MRHYIIFYHPKKVVHVQIFLDFTRQTTHKFARQREKRDRNHAH